MTDPTPDMSASVRGVVLSGTGGIWRVFTENGETVDTSLRGRLKTRTATAEDRSAPREKLKLAVGDDVRIEREEDSWAICEILPRRSKLARREPGGGPRERVIVANLDQVVVVFAAANPEPHVRMLDRFLVIAESNHIAAIVVVNKIELTGEDAARAVFGDYERAGYPVLYTSVKRDLHLIELRARLAGRTSALTGPSGVGKSSLVNALFPGLSLRVGEISASVNKGRHTTVGAVMVPLPEGAGFVVDTPGLREVGISELLGEPLDICFPEFRELIAECRFGDCTHRAEPDCAITSGVRDGSISRARYESYLGLRAETE